MAWADCNKNSKEPSYRQLLLFIYDACYVRKS